MTGGIHPRLAQEAGATTPRSVGALLAGLPGLAQDALREGSVLWEVPAGKRVLSEGQVPDVWFGVASGLVELELCCGEDATAVAGIVGPGMWCGGHHLLAASPLPYAATTLCRSTLLVMRRSVLRRLLEQHPGLERWLAQLTLRTGDSMVRHMKAQLTGPVAQCVFLILDALADCVGERSNTGRRIGVRLTQAQIGRLAGVSRQRVNEELRSLKRSGLLRMVDGCIDLSLRPPAQAQPPEAAAA